MFHQTQTARKPPSACAAVTPNSDGMVPPAAGWRHLQRTAYATLHNALSSMGRNTPFGDFDLWPWHSNSSEQGTKYVFHVNLAQIRSTVPKIFHTKTKWKSHRQG